HAATAPRRAFSLAKRTRAIALGPGRHPGWFPPHPVSQAADITAFRTTLAPVGDDQGNHVHALGQPVRLGRAVAMRAPSAGICAIGRSAPARVVSPLFVGPACRRISLRIWSIFAPISTKSSKTIRHSMMPHCGFYGCGIGAWRVGSATAKLFFIWRNIYGSTRTTAIWRTGGSRYPGRSSMAHGTFGPDHQRDH